jgi:hypothetical protein
MKRTCKKIANADAKADAKANVNDKANAKVGAKSSIFFRFQTIFTHRKLQPAAVAKADVNAVANA